MRGDTARSPIVAVVLTAAFLALSPGVASAAEPCTTAPSPAIKVDPVPYSQQRFDLARVRPLATGKGITVAVIDSGVDDDHPQLDGKVLEGKDFLRDGPNGYQDCNGHGTGVASLIVAGTPSKGGIPDVDLQGIAPDAQILPVRVSEQKDLPDGESAEPGISDTNFAAAIRYAANNAKVINMSLALYRDSPVVADAIRFAREKDVVIVAAAGNEGGAQDGNRPPFPAAYDGVLGVGAIDQAGFRARFSQHGSYVDVVAPGTGITIAAVGGGYLYNEGTSFASPFVAGTAALLRQRFPEMSADQVAQRIMATTDPAPGGVDSDFYGMGVLNPYRALTESLAPPSTLKPAPVVMRAATPEELAVQRRRDESRTMSFIVAGVGIGVAMIAGLVAVVLPRGFRRRWQAGDPT